MTNKNAKIETLTQEQEAMIPVYLDRYLKIGLSTEPTDRVKAESAIRACYKYLKLTDPEIVWASSPFEGAKLAAQFAAGDLEVTKEQVAKQAENASYGSFEAYWVSFYSFIAEQLPVEKDELIDIVNDIVKNCGVYWTFDDLVVMTPKPVRIQMQDGKLHDTEDYALKYEDGTGIISVNGTVFSCLLEAKIESMLGSSEPQVS